MTDENKCVSPQLPSRRRPKMCMQEQLRRPMLGIRIIDVDNTSYGAAMLTMQMTTMQKLWRKLAKRTRGLAASSHNVT